MIGEFQSWKQVASILSQQVIFVSEALNVLPLIPTTRVEYAGTDDKSIMVNPKTWEVVREELLATDSWFPTDQGAIAAVLLHECFHVILKHRARGASMPRVKQRQKAVDIVVNNILVDIFATPPFSYTGEKMLQFKKALAAAGTFDERFRGKDTESVYTTLCEEEEEEEDTDDSPSQVSITMSGSSSGEESAPSDGKDKSEGDGGSDSGGDDEKDKEEKPSSGAGGGQDPQDKPLGNDLCPDHSSGVPDDVEELIGNAMTDYLERNASYAPAGSSLARELIEARRKPPIPMSEILKKVTDVVSGTVFDYRKPSRMDSFTVLLGHEGRMPSYREDPTDKLRELVIGFDMSGSFGEAERQAGFALVRDSFKYVKRNIRLLAFTDHVVQDEVITRDTVLSSNHSGGTRIASLIDYLDNPNNCSDPSKNGKPIRPSAIVIITDGLDPYSMPLLDAWKYRRRLRNIVIGSKVEMPGLTFHADCIDGFPRS